jgi:hypothetical protein
MGVELYVYSPSEAIVASEELRQKLRSEGWDVRFVLDQGKPVLEPAAEGPLTELLDVMGWPSTWEKGILAAEVIDSSDLKSLQALYDEGVVGTCGYRVESPYEFKEELVDEDGFEDEEEDQEPIDANLQEAMRNARTRYQIRVRIRSSNQSYKFMNIVWQAIGQLRDGLLVDPQTGEFRYAR